MQNCVKPYVAHAGLIVYFLQVLAIAIALGKNRAFRSKRLLPEVRERMCSSRGVNRYLLNRRLRCQCSGPSGQTNKNSQPLNHHLPFSFIPFGIPRVLGL